MNVDLQRVRGFAPLGVFVVLLLVGWPVAVTPVMSTSAAAAIRVDELQRRLQEAQAILGDASYEATPGAKTLDDVMPAGDPSSKVLQELTSLAKGASATNLLIETGDRVAIGPAAGPRVSSGAPAPDPRLALLNARLAYSPITMSFDARFAEAGRFFWLLRDLATLVEINKVEISRAAAEGSVHVAVTLFAYARADQAGADGGLP